MERKITRQQARALRTLIGAGGDMPAHESYNPTILVHLAARGMVSMPVTITERGRKALQDAKTRGF